MDITDRIIEKYKKDRSIKDEYVLNDDEMYLIDEIVQLKIGQNLPIHNAGTFDRLEEIINTPQPSPYLEKGYKIIVDSHKDGHTINLLHNNKSILKHSSTFEDLETVKKSFVELLLIMGIHGWKFNGNL